MFLRRETQPFEPLQKIVDLGDLTDRQIATVVFYSRNVRDQTACTLELIGRIPTIHERAAQVTSIASASTPKWAPAVSWLARAAAQALLAGKNRQETTSLILNTKVPAAPPADHAHHAFPA